MATRDSATAETLRRVLTSNAATTRSSVAPSQKLVWDTGWVTLAGVGPITDEEGLTQPSAKYFDAGQFTTLTLKLLVPGLTTGVDVHVESSSTLEGPWEECIPPIEAVTKSLVVISSEGGDRLFSRYIRWSVFSDVQAEVNWVSCFRIQAIAGVTGW